MTTDQGLTARRVRRLVDDGRLVTIATGNRWRVVAPVEQLPPAELDEDAS